MTKKRTVAHIDRLRPSRDGDQFHYWWAARRCLRLLEPGTDLVSISIEGPATTEGGKIAAGVDVIDLAEYHGSTDLKTATRIRYMQLKHSTRRASEAWTASLLGETLSRFGERYTALVERFGEDDVTARFSFEFISNRPISGEVKTALKLLQQGDNTTARTIALRKVIGLAGAPLHGFAKTLTIIGDEGDYIEQRRLLDYEHVRYLPGRDEDAPNQLKEMVTRRATSEHGDTPEVERLDVLKALGVREVELLPAPCLIEKPSLIIPREHLPAVVSAIAASSTAFILTAEGGEGKSVAAIQMGSYLPEGSMTFVYDCFGNGGYRSMTGYRHRASQGLVQLANQMAIIGLNAPLLPSSKADERAYMHAFVDRVGQASQALAFRSRDALLCFIIDAADNAELIAQELQDGPSFPRLLLREKMPDNVRLVLTSRGHRAAILDPPQSVRHLRLGAFTLAETKAHLVSQVGSVSSVMVAEFHRLTSENPRVQAAIFAEGGTIDEMLGRLGPEPLTVDATIAQILHGAIERVRDASLGQERDKLDRLCEALATLRPFVPLEVLAKSVDVPVAMVRSFVNDMQRPLIIKGDALQFRDEPTETWFRERFRPPSSRVGALVDRLMPLAEGSSYVAASLPQLLLEAGRFDDLVALALSGAALPSENFSRLEVELQRLQFAIKAAIRRGSFVHAAQLAMKAGNEASAHERQQKLIGAHTDLAARFVDEGTLSEKVSRREVPAAGWTGSEHAYVAGLLSGCPTLEGDASSHLRLAYDWLRHWARTPADEFRGKSRVEAEDFAEIAMAELNLHGPDACARALRGWRRREMSFAVGRLLISRLVDACRFEVIDALAESAGNDLGLLLAICTELDLVGRTPPSGPVRRAVRIVMRWGVEVRQCDDVLKKNVRLIALTALAIAASHAKVATDDALGRMLGRYIRRSRIYLDSGPLSGSHDDRDLIARAYAVRAVLLGRPIDSKSIVRLGLRWQSRDKGDVYRLSETLSRLVPWHRLEARIRLGKAVKSLAEYDVVAAGMAVDRASSREGSNIANAIARLWSTVLLSSNMKGTPWSRFDAWTKGLGMPLSIPTHAAIARRAARTPGFAEVALNHAQIAFGVVIGERDHAETLADNCVSVARAILPVSEPEARFYFKEAVRASANIGDENLSRFTSLLLLGDVATRLPRNEQETAYRLSRAGELTYSLVARDKHFDYWHCVEVLTGLSSASGPTILSRWADRRFGSHRDLLPTAITALLKRGDLAPLDALCLFPFRTGWEHENFLSGVLESINDKQAQQAAVYFVMHYLRLGGGGAASWQAVAAAARKAGMDCVGVLEDTQCLPLGAAPSTPFPSSRRGARRGGSFNKVFLGLDPTILTDLRVAVARFQKEPIRDWKDFLAETIARIPAGCEVAFINGLATIEHFHSYNLNDLLRKLPPSWRRPAIKSALGDLVRAMAGRSPHLSAVNREYSPVDWQLAEELAGVRHEEAIRIQAETSAQSAATIGADELFTLAGRLSRLMSPDEALAALEYGLNLYEPQLDTKDGDGVWSAKLIPPSLVRRAVAGYVWGALASPFAARRWEAAHVVRAAARLSCSGLLDDLLDIATIGEGLPYAAPALEFYRWHGLLWLMIGIARAAAESGNAITPHIDWLRRYAATSEPHILVRAFAARALVALADQGLLELSASEHAGLLAIYCPPAIYLANRSGPSTDAVHQQVDAEDTLKFLTPYDFNKYWIEPLARRLGISSGLLKETMEQVVRNDWGLIFTGRWSEDVRGFRDQFDQADLLESRRPSADTLSQYLSYHALMIAAGKLIATETPLVTSPENRDWDSFASWFADVGLTRQDGVWLADRRDVTPVDIAPRLTIRQNWIEAIKNGDLKRQLQPFPDFVTVRAEWQRLAGIHYEQIQVTSALVSRERARSLARALQIADHYDQWLPGYDDGGDIDHGGFQLTGWVEESGAEGRLDSDDPWAAGCSGRPYVPAEPVRALLGLEESPICRSWLINAQTVALRSEAWSEGEDDDKNDVRHGRGRRLLASPTFITALLDQADKSLIVQVSVRRGRHRPRYEQRKAGEKNEYQKTGIFLIERGGRIWTP